MLNTQIRRARALDRSKETRRNGNGDMSNPAHVILSVDDDPPDLELIIRVLVRNGFNVEAARSAEKALTIMQEVIPAVLIVDVMIGFQTERTELSAVRLKSPRNCS